MTETDVELCYFVRIGLVQPELREVFSQDCLSEDCLIRNKLFPRPWPHRCFSCTGLMSSVLPQQVDNFCLQYTNTHPDSAFFVSLSYKMNECAFFLLKHHKDNFGHCDSLYFQIFHHTRRIRWYILALCPSRSLFSARSSSLPRLFKQLEDPPSWRRGNDFQVNGGERRRGGKM